MDEKVGEIKKIIEQHLKNEDFLISLYLYGSILRDDYKQNVSDIDVLMIVKDYADINKIKQKINEINILYNNLRLEFTVITEYEFYNGFHPGWSKYFFVALKHSNIFVCGRDIIDELNFEIDFDSIYKKTIWLCQRLRNIVLNNIKQKEIEFWDRKYDKWIKIIVSEILYMRGIYEPSLQSSLLKFRQLYPSVYINLDNNEAKYQTLQSLENFLIALRKNERIRQGVIVILKKYNKEEFLLLQSKDEWKGWEPIKGGIEINETIEDAVRREIYEEIGIKDIEIKKIFPFKVTLSMISDRGLEKRVYTPVLVEYNDKSKIRLENKFIKADAFAMKDIVKKLKWPAYRNLFYRVLSIF